MVEEEMVVAGLVGFLTARGWGGVNLSRGCPRRW